MNARLVGLAMLAAWLLAQPAAARLPVVLGEPAVAAKAQAVPHLRLSATRASVARLQLADASAEALASVREANARSEQSKAHGVSQRLVIGVTRATDRVQGTVVSWTAVAGGHAAHVAITSPNAAALRIAIDLAGAPLDTEMTFFGSANPARLEGPVRVREILDRGAAWWSPITEGDTQTVEFFIPGGVDPRRVGLRVVSASHLLATPSSGLAKRQQDIGRSGSCNVDVPCSAQFANAAFQDIAESVAQMVFTDGPYTALCTGTLLNDTDSSTQVPYFYSANHCFENDTLPHKTHAQMQVVANTLTTIWGFEADACADGRGSGKPPATWTQQGGGATLLYNHPQSDALFLRLNGTPPTGAFFSGWDPNPLATGSAVLSIHHPQGDLKKVSEGVVQRFAAPGVAGGSRTFAEVLWGRGTTEGGSSGGGLWTASSGQLLFRGGLWGGSALCSNTSGTDFFSRFDQVYPALSSYLAKSGAGSIDYSDLWWNEGESGWGLNLIQHASRIIFGVWYTYDDDGKRTWLVLPSGSWTTENVYSGPLYATSGPHLAQSFDANKVSAVPVGSATLTFSDANSGTFAYTVRGVSGTKAIRRQPF